MIIKTCLLRNSIWGPAHLYLHSTQLFVSLLLIQLITDVILLVLRVLVLPQGLQGQRLLGAELERGQGGGGVKAADVPPGEGGEHLVVSCPETLAPEIKQQGGQGVGGEESPLQLRLRRPESGYKQSSILQTV